MAILRFTRLPLLLVMLGAECFALHLRGGTFRTDMAGLGSRSFIDEKQQPGLQLQNFGWGIKEFIANLSASWLFKAFVVPTLLLAALAACISKVSRKERTEDRPQLPVLLRSRRSQECAKTDSQDDHTQVDPTGHPDGESYEGNQAARSSSSPQQHREVSLCISVKSDDEAASISSFRQRAPATLAVSDDDDKGKEVAVRSSPPKRRQEVSLIISVESDKEEDDRVDLHCLESSEIQEVAVQSSSPKRRQEVSLCISVENDEDEDFDLHCLESGEMKQAQVTPISSFRRSAPARLAINDSDDGEGKEDGGGIGFYEHEHGEQASRTSSLQRRAPPATLAVDDSDDDEGKEDGCMVSDQQEDSQNEQGSEACASADWLPLLDGVQVQRQVGKGNSRCVFQAALSDGRHVAALTNVSATESQVLRRLAKLDNDFVPRIFGRCQLGESSLLLQQLAACDLRALLSKDPHWSAQWGPASVKQAALGVAFIGQCLVAHGDVSARNLLLLSTCPPRLQICDYGNSALLSSVGDIVKVAAFKASRWSSPVSYLTHQVSIREDAWSLGVLAWETLTSKSVPFECYSSCALGMLFSNAMEPDISSEELSEAQAAVRENFQFGGAVPQVLQEAVHGCLALRGDERTTAEGVAEAAALCCLGESAGDRRAPDISEAATTPMNRVSGSSYTFTDCDTTPLCGRGSQPQC